MPANPTPNPKLADNTTSVACQETVMPRLDMALIDRLATLACLREKSLDRAASCLCLLRRLCRALDGLLRVLDFNVLLTETGRLVRLNIDNNKKSN